MQSVLYSCIGTTDPVRGMRDGGLMHILRFYRPEAVYLFLSQEMIRRDREDDRIAKTFAFLDELLGACSLSRANLLYSGGGHCYLLLPNTQAAIENANAWNLRINDWLLEQFGGQLFVAHGWTACSGNDLTNTPTEDAPYTAMFHRVSTAISRHKLHRYSPAQLRRINQDSAADDGREYRIGWRILPAHPPRGIRGIQHLCPNTPEEADPVFPQCRFRPQKSIQRGSIPDWRSGKSPGAALLQTHIPGGESMIQQGHSCRAGLCPRQQHQRRLADVKSCFRGSILWITS